MADFLIETTNENGVVEQQRVAFNQTELDLRNRSLVRIVGLERATALKTLAVHRLNQPHFWCRISCFLVLFVKLSHNCFVDVPAYVLAMTQLDALYVSLVLVLVSSLCVADSSSALCEPLVVSSRCHWPHDGVDTPSREN
jgi:hypothetical protein